MITRYRKNASGFTLVELLVTMAGYDPTDTAPTLSDIRAVTLSILATTANADPHFNSSQAFTSASGATGGLWTTANGHRGSFATFTVRCRNMEL
jgi:hypothetical protein